MSTFLLITPVLFTTILYGKWSFISSGGFYMASYHLFVMDVDCKLFCSPLLYFDMLSIILLTNYIAYYKRFGYVKLVLQQMPVLQSLV
jgi:hypothetical protein